jgi:uncharacterized membrane protein (UPF0127 family)
MPSLKVIAVAVAAAVVIIAGYEVYTLSLQPGAVTTGVPTSFTVNGKTYSFNYTATTPAERAKGLMNTSVTPSTTMLFAFPSFARWSFWMYDTNTSLDMIWLNATGSAAKVVYLVTSAPPCYDSGACAVYTPSSAADYVIEARAGFAAANGISVGSVIELG